jgi:type IV pilus assembly protein PilM
MAFGLDNVFKQFTHSLASHGKEHTVGIDIGSSSMKVVELYDNKGVPTLNTYGELQLGPYGDIEIGRTTNLQVATLAQALIDIVRESSVATKSGVLAIPYNASFVTVITVQTTDQNEINSLIPTEAKKYIPVPMNSVSLDWFVLSSGENNTSKVLVAAIHNESLKRYRSAVAAAGLKDKTTEIEIFSAVRSSIAQEDTAVGVLDMGASGTRLYITDRGSVRKAHSIRVGGLELTQLLASTLHMEFVEAEELKRGGLSNHAEAEKVLTSALQRGFHEIAQVIKRYEEDEKQTVEKVILSGGGALLLNVDKVAQDIFGKSVVRSDPFSKTAYPAFLEDVLTEAGPSFSVAVGAALRMLMTQK